MKLTAILAILSLPLFLTGCFSECGPNEERENIFAECTRKTTSPSSGGSTSITSPTVSFVFNRDFDPTPIITVSGVQNGYIVKVYSDSSCQNEVVSGTSTGTSIELTLPALTLNTNYTFYAKSFTNTGSSSSCSTASAPYRYVDCPSRYFAISGSTTRGVFPFCVMQFEAKNVSNSPTSQPALTPWTNVSANTAKSACRSLAAEDGSYYDLISSQEWMTVADDILATAGNSLSKGNYNNEQSPLAVTDETNYWNGVTLAMNPTTNVELRRTYVLSTGEIIWDLAGNAWEYADYGTLANYTSPPGCTSSTGGGSVDASTFSSGNYCSSWPTNHYMTLSGLSLGLNSVSATGGGRSLFRGGGYNDMGRSGVTSVTISATTPSDTAAATGFRCVKRFMLSSPTSLSVTKASDIYPSTTVTVSGVDSGNTVTVYSDSNCSTSVASAIASGSSVSIAVSSLSNGTHTFYAKRSTSTGLFSKCSTASVSYEYKACPSGYVPVSGNATYSTNAFCVMKFEAKNVSGVATSQALLQPWTNLSANDAKANCRALNSVGQSKYDLISNSEWMTIVEDLFPVTTNWPSGTPGTNSIASGNKSGTETLPISDVNDYWSGMVDSVNSYHPCTGTQPGECRRTLSLSNGYTLWDLSGNAAEIVDYGTSSTYTSPPACSYGFTGDSSAAASGCPDLPSIAYHASVFVNTSGRVTGSSSATTTLARGGSYSNPAEGTSVPWMLKYAETEPSSAIGDKFGFRCVYRP